MREYFIDINIRVYDNYNFIEGLRKNKIYKNACKENNEFIVIDKNGAKIYIKDNNIHRENKAAVIYKNYVIQFYYKGKLHRDKGPACIYIEGSYKTTLWYQHGLLHRNNKPAYIGDNGTMKWYQYGKLHNEKGPANICHDYDSTFIYKEWYINNKIHRIDGPAFIGSIIYYPIDTCKYYLFKKKYTKEEWKKERMKLAIKYARVWYQKCDHPGTIIWKNNLEKSLDGIDNLSKKIENLNYL